MCKDPEMRESKMSSGNKTKIFNIEHKDPPSRTQNQERAQLTEVSIMGCV